jgi:tetratricopeptide (TPR) repeat protein
MKGNSPPAAAPASPAATPVVAGMVDPALIHKADEGPKKPPKPELCAAFGDYRLREASAPQYSQTQREQLWEEARRAYQQALTLDSKCLAAHRGMARLATAMDDSPRAVACYEKALKIAPKDAVLWFELGMCHNHTQQYDKVLQELSRAMELDPGNKQYGNARAILLARVGRLAESLECFEKVNGAAVAHYNLACTLRRLNQPDLSRQHLEMALEKNPKMTSAQALLAEMSRPGPVVQPVQPVGYSEPQTPPGPAGQPETPAPPRP